MLSMSEREIRKYMKRALALAARGAGMTHPNPMVGAVVVSDGGIVSEAWHKKAGEPHAEALALERAGALARGGVMFVNLEPCCHFGRTPPCTSAIIEAGISHVYAACGDPHSLVDGRGFQALRRAGVDVTSGVLSREAEELNRAFFHFCREGTPYMTLKLASTLDGRIAAPDGESKWITGEKARKFVHRLRAQVDAVLVGAGTVAADDPSLTSRGAGRITQPFRIVLDHALATHPGSRILDRGMAESTILVVGEDTGEDRCALYRKKGAHLLKLGARDGIFRWRDLARELVDKGIFHILAEGGGTTAAWMLRESAVNRIELFMAPKFLGAPGVPAVGDLGIVSLKEAPGFAIRKIRRIGDDLQITAEPK